MRSMKGIKELSESYDFYRRSMKPFIKHTVKSGRMNDGGTQ